MAEAPATPEKLFAFFDQLGILHQTVTHQAVFTVEEASKYHDQIPGFHCKNLFLKDSKNCLYLVVMPANKRADIKQVEARSGSARLSFCKSELLAQILGVAPGSVTPFGVINDNQKKVTVILDNDMMASKMVTYHPLHNEASTTIRSEDLLTFLKALDYEPLIIDCGA